MSYESEHAAWGRAADTEIATLNDEKLSLGYELAAADITIAQQEQALLEKNAEIERLNDAVAEKDTLLAYKDTVIARKNARIDSLKRQLADCQGTTTKKF